MTPFAETKRARIAILIASFAPSEWLMATHSALFRHASFIRSYDLDPTPMREVYYIAAQAMLLQKKSGWRRLLP